MKRQLLILCLALAATTTFAQRQLPTQRPWSKGPLTFADFRGRPSSEADGSYADFYLGLQEVADTIDGIVMPREVATALFRPYASWMLPGSRDAKRLRYHQLQFDLLELSRRELHRDLDGHRYAPDYAFYLADSTLARRLWALDSISARGADTSSFAVWDSLVSTSLAALPESHVPTALRHTWGTELGFSMGSRTFRGPLHDAFKSGFDLGFLISLLHGRHSLSMDLDMGFASLRYSLFTVDGPFYTDEQAVDLRLLLEYGFRVVDRNRWSLTPFVGGGLHSISQGDDEDEDFGVNAATVAAGLLFMYRPTMSFSPLTDGTVDRYDFDIMAKAYATYSSFGAIVDPSSSGWGIYLHLGLAIGYSTYEPRR